MVDIYRCSNSGCGKGFISGALGAIIINSGGGGKMNCGICGSNMIPSEELRDSLKKSSGVIFKI